MTTVIESLVQCVVSHHTCIVAKP